LAICASKIIKFGGDLTKKKQKKKRQGIWRRELDLRHFNKKFSKEVFLRSFDYVTWF